jgi:hypothetical protein
MVITIVKSHHEEKKKTRKSCDKNESCGIF